MFPSFWATHAEAFVILQSKTCHCASESRVSIFLATALFQLLSFCKVEQTIALQKVVFPSSGRCTLRLLSFCEVEHTIAFQKVVFPSVWPLHACPHLMAHGSSLVSHINADNVLTVHAYCHMLGAKTLPENPSSNLFPKISCFTEEGSDAQKVRNICCNHMFTVTLFTYSEVLGSVGFIPAFAVSYAIKMGLQKVFPTFWPSLYIFDRCSRRTVSHRTGIFRVRPAKKSSTNFRLYPFLLRTSLTGSCGRGDGPEQEA